MRIQVTPLPAESFCTFALKVVPLVPAKTELTWLIVTEIAGGGLIVNASVSDLVGSVVEVAVSVGLSLGDAGAVAGGV